LPATKPDGKRFYRPELDALRFIAFLLVFVCHILQDAGLGTVLGGKSPLIRSMERALSLISEVGTYGVALFFLLSAYLITELMLIEYARTGDFKVKDFYVRRILRIWPLYFATIGLFIFLSWLDPVDFKLSAGRVIAFLALSGNWYLIYRGTFPAEFGVLWSISVEEQFYLLWPGIFTLGKRRGIVFACILFPLISAATLAYLGVAGAGRVAAWMNSFVQFLFFAVGGGLALMMSQRVPRWPVSARMALAGGGVAVWLITEATTHIQQRDTVIHSAGLLIGFAGIAVGTAAIFLSVLGIRAELVPRWWRYLGKISYGLYVFHPLAIVGTERVMSVVAHSLHFHRTVMVLYKLACPVLALGVTIGAAAVSYRFLESPFLRLRRRFTVVASRPV